MEIWRASFFLKIIQDLWDPVRASIFLVARGSRCGQSLGALDAVLITSVFRLVEFVAVDQSVPWCGVVLQGIGLCAVSVVTGLSHLRVRSLGQCFRTERRGLGSCCCFETL